MRSWLKVLNDFWGNRGLILSKRWLSARAQTQIMGLACMLLASSSNTLLAAVRVQPIPALRTSAPGFELVQETDSGIRFVNSVPDSQIMANHNVMLGSGVAAGDVDGDGLTDLFFCSLNGSNALYRNLGAWRFEPVPEAGGAAYPGMLNTSALLSDADGDGDLDLFVGSLGHGVRLLLNNGQGRFSDVTSSSGLASKTGTMSLAAGDVDLDGDLDLYVVNYGAQAVLRTGSGSATVKKIDGNWVVQGPHADRLRYVDGRLEEVGEPDVLFLCVGPGKYRAVPWGGPEFVDAEGKPQVMPWDFGLAAQIRDINQDGNPDIYVCNDFQTPDRIWLGDGKGRFRALPWLAMRCQSFASMGVDFADVDRDGHLDFYVVEMLPSEHSRRLRQTASRPPFALTPGFFENRPEVTRSTFFRARGDGTFAEMAQFSGLDATDWSWQPVFLDVDLDGWEDILVVNGYPRDTQDRDALAAIQAAGRGTPGQSRSNFLRYPVMKNRNLAFRNLGDLKFKEQGREWGFDSDRISQGVLLADLDQDGDGDVVISCLNAGPVLLRNLAASPRIGVRLKQPGLNPRGIGARIRVIGKKLIQEQEVISGGRYLSSDDAIRYFAAPDAELPLRLEVMWPGGKTTRVEAIPPQSLCEITPDRSDVPTRGPPPLSPPIFSDASAMVKWKHEDPLFNDYARQPLLPRQLSQAGPGMVVADLDQDGSEEWVVGCGKGGSLGFFRFQPGIGFLPIALESEWKAPDDVTGLAVWKDPEGRRSVLLSVSGYETDARSAGLWRLSIPQGSTRGRIERQQGLSGFPQGPGGIAVADYDRDGVEDVFVCGRVQPGAYPDPTSSRLYSFRGNQWVADEDLNQAFRDLGLATSAAWIDYNQDGNTDIAIACEWGSVRLFGNFGGKFKDETENLGLGGHSGLWGALLVADLDQDGRQDLVAGNWGLNTGVGATTTQPLTLDYGDMLGRGSRDLVEGYFARERGQLVPRRSLGALGQAFPPLWERFQSHAKFSEASLEEVLGALPGHKRRVLVTTLESALFLNRPGRFQKVELPMEAQMAPVQAIACADWDRDGHLDLYLSQNFFPLRTELPRLDAGVGSFLRGDGKGGFQAWPAASMGTHVYGDARGCLAWDFDRDGRSDLVVAQNNSAIRVFQNRFSPRPAPSNP